MIVEMTLQFHNIDQQPPPKFKGGMSRIKSFDYYKITSKLKETQNKGYQGRNPLVM